MHRGTALSLFIAGSVLLPDTVPAQSARTIDSAWDLRCLQRELTISCDYRPIEETGGPTRIASYWNDVELPITQREEYTAQNPASIAVLFLTDTSDPRRARIVRQNGEQIGAMVQAAPPDSRLGVADFDKEMRLRAPVGSDHETLLLATQQLRAEGKTTELYRNTLEAIEVLRDEQAERKAIFLMSDGLAEDTAYYLEDVVEEALIEQVILVGLGFARTPAQSVALQTLRRLSLETGGYFAEADLQARLPQEFLAAPFAPLLEGGRFALDLRPITETAGGIQSIRIDLEGTDGVRSYQRTVTLPEIETPPEAAIPPAVEHVQQPPAAPLAPPEKTWAQNLPLILLAALALLLAVLLSWRLRPRDDTISASAEQAREKPYGYLEWPNEDDAEPQPITRPIWRIGRGENNDLVLKDASISRYHAELRYQNGYFELADLGSLNGVFVDNQKIEKARLPNGKLFEVGDVALRISLADPSLPVVDATQLAGTHAPMQEDEETTVVDGVGMGFENGYRDPPPEAADETSIESEFRDPPEADEIDIHDKDRDPPEDETIL